MRQETRLVNDYSEKKDVQQQPQRRVKQWIEQCVIDLSLCPFASVPYRAGRVRVSVCQKASEASFLDLIEAELIALDEDVDIAVETTLVAAPYTLPDFLDFNDFLERVEALLATNDRQSRLQIASFHPHYQFAGASPSDAGNYTNRAPYPIVQWLRADTVARAVEVADTLAIPDRNIARLKAMTANELRSLFPWAISR